MVRNGHIWHWDAFDNNFPLQTSSTARICAHTFGVNVYKLSRKVEGSGTRSATPNFAVERTVRIGPVS
jgi:hypothetical protein